MLHRDEAKNGMISEILLMAALRYVPGWMRSEVPQEGVMPAISNAFPKAILENLYIKSSEFLKPIK